MTGVPSKTEEALRDLRAAVMPVDEVDAVSRRRRLTVARLEIVQAGLRTRSGAMAKRRRFFGFSVAAAACFGAGVFAWHTSSAPRIAEPRSTLLVVSGAAQVTHGKTTSSLNAGSTEDVSQTDAIATTEDGSAVLSLPSGAKITEDEGTSLVLEDTGLAARRGPRTELVNLSVGRVAVVVPKLHGGAVLSVRTTEATVTVHGTRFVVEETRNGSARATHVHVSEGVVTVASPAETVELHAGEDWSSDRATSPVVALGHASESGSSASGVHDVGTPDSREPTAPGEAHPSLAKRADDDATSVSSKGRKRRSSTLEKENALLEAGMAAARRADDPKALRFFDRLILDYPESPLIGAARLERRRAAERLGTMPEAR